VAAGLGTMADLRFVGLGDAGPDADPAGITGCEAARNRALPRGRKLSGKALAAVRARSSTASLVSRTGVSSARSAQIPGGRLRSCVPCWRWRTGKSPA